MSEVYIKEPGTKGKAILHTTHGDLEIELWSNEAPKACRNFCQLILEGYYNGTIFHRVIRDFIIQGGDDTNTGKGSESIYGKPYEDEIHSRLKFRYRGMMGIASAGRGTKTNGSQFFIVLNRAPTLDGKHTLFAKVVGQTIYNLVRLSECEVDKNDCPVEPPRVIRAELVWDPFEDLEPRRRPEPPRPALTINCEHPAKRDAIKNKNKLSFGESEAEESDDDDKTRFGKAKSAHDALNDPRLSQQAARRPENNKKGNGAEERQRREAESTPSIGDKKAKPRPAGDSDSDDADFTRAAAHSDDEEEDSSDDDVAEAAASIRQQEILKLKRQIAGMSSDNVVSESATKVPKAPKTALQERQLGYNTREKRVKPKGKERKRQEAMGVLGTLKDFQDRLKHAVLSPPNDDTNKEVKKRRVEDDKQSEKEDGTFAAIWEEGDEEGDEDWLGGNGLKFHTSADKAFKLESLKARRRLEIFDPLAAKGNNEIIAEESRKRSDNLRTVPSMRRNAALERW